jgi:cellulose synthase/poly-beta-1,6-N-acetylglucosamine synthase-like glycosyltransferase
MFANFFSQRAAGGAESPSAQEAEESRMNWNKWIRQFHRWVSIVFTATVIANFAAFGFGEPPLWLVYSPLPPLFLLLFSGLYMFALPYIARRRRAAS